MSSIGQDEWPGLPDGVRSRTLPVRDLDVHFFEAGKPTDPLILLLHGFPEIAYSWRKVILPLSHAGGFASHVVAPDLRGFGRTKPLDPAAPGAARPLAFADDVRPYQTLNLVADAAALVSALGHDHAACLIGHDAGATIAGFTALAHPDLFRSVVFLSTPFPGPPSPSPSPSPRPGPESASSMKGSGAALFPATLLEDALGRLDPPRKHYMLYYSTPDANAHMSRAAPQGLHAFLRGYFHIKSADCAANDPHPLDPREGAAALAELPHYYVMPRDATMVDVARAGAPSAEEAGACAWLPDEELAVYVREYMRTGFQGGLNRYRAATDPALAGELAALAGRTLDRPAMYMAGRKDWGVYQNPGAVDRMREEACTGMDEADVLFVPGAGHWVQQENPEKTVQNISQFLKRVSPPFALNSAGKA
ncbi:alpha/beta-hydrolase [Trametes polyzona]|nr:alpha/beta-hydrolase [Trametes polyzona]